MCRGVCATPRTWCARCPRAHPEQLRFKHPSGGRGCHHARVPICVATGDRSVPVPPFRPQGRVQSACTVTCANPVHVQSFLAGRLRHGLVVVRLSTVLLCPCFRVAGCSRRKLTTRRSQMSDRTTRAEPARHAVRAEPTHRSNSKNNTQGCFINPRRAPPLCGAPWRRAGERPPLLGLVCTTRGGVADTPRAHGRAIAARSRPPAPVSCLR